MARKLSLSKIEEKVRRIKELEDMLFDLSSEVDELKTEIKEEMRRRGVEVLSGSDWKVSYTKYSSSRFDSSSFRESHPKLYEKFTRLREASRFTIN